MLLLLFRLGVKLESILLLLLGNKTLLLSELFLLGSKLLLLLRGKLLLLTGSKLLLLLGSKLLLLLGSKLLLLLLLVESVEILIKINMFIRFYLHLCFILRARRKVTNFNIYIVYGLKSSKKLIQL